MPNEINFYQNVYKNKDGNVMISERVWSSIDEVKKAIELASKRGNVYVTTIKLNTCNVLK